MTHIQAQRYFSRDYVASPWLYRSLSHSGNHTWYAACQGLYSEHKFRRCTERVVAERHGNCAGMTCFTGKSDTETILSRDCCYDSNRQIARFKHWSLFNVNLAVAQKFIRGPASNVEAFWIMITPKRAYRLSHCDTLDIGQMEHTRI